MQSALMALSATLLLQIGYFLWKVAVDGHFNRNQSTAWLAGLSLILSWRWLLGLVMVVAGWLLFVQATTIGELSLIQPLMSAGDVVLVLLSVTFLRERLSLRESLGIGVAIVGAILLAVGAVQVQARWYNQTALSLLLSILAVSVLTALWCSRQRAKAEVCLALAVGLSFGSGAVLTKVLSAQQAALSIAVLSWSTVGNPMLAAVIAANVLGLVLLHVAFKLGRAAIVVPVQLATASAVAVLGGVLVFDESITLARICGVAIILAGTSMLHGCDGPPKNTHEKAAARP